MKSTLFIQILLGTWCSFLVHMQGRVRPRGNARPARRATTAKTAHSAAGRAAFAGDW
jgi:hypothetical protein